MAHLAMKATTSVNRPSRMKIQDQDLFPPTRSILLIPKARSPPKAPAAVAAEKKRAILRPHSCLRYLLSSLVNCYRRVVVRKYEPHGDVICNALEEMSAGFSWDQFPSLFSSTEQNRNYSYRETIHLHRYQGRLGRPWGHCSCEPNRDRWCK